MSDLLNTAEGRNALLVAQKFQLERRLSRFFHRTIVIDVNDFHYGLSEFDLATMLGQLNVAHDPSILEMFRLLGAIGGLQHTIMDMDYYVNATTGSDVNGTGSSARPFETLWFLENLPRRIDHFVRIIIQSDIDTPAEALHLDFDFGENGSLIILGQAQERLLSADMEITDTNQLLGDGGIFAETAAAPPVAIDDSFMRANGFAVPIHRRYVNGGTGDFGYNVLQFPWNVGGVIVGNDMFAIRPTHTLAIKSLCAQCTGANRRGLSQLAILNLNVTFYNPPPGPAFDAKNDVFVWENKCDTTLSFVLFQRWQGQINNSGARISGRVNRVPLLDHTSAIILAQTTLDNLDYPNTDIGPFFPWICGARFGGSYNLGSPSYSADQNHMSIEDASIWGLDIFGGVICRGANQIDNCAFGHAELRNANCQFQYCMLDGIQTLVGAKQRGGIEMYSSLVDAEYCTFIDSDNCFACWSNCYCKIVMCGSDPVYTGGTISNAGIFAQGYNSFQLFYNNATGVTPATVGLSGAVSDMAGWTIAGTIPAPFGAVETPTTFGVYSICTIFQ